MIRVAPAISAVSDAGKAVCAEPVGPAAGFGAWGRGAGAEADGGMIRPLQAERVRAAATSAKDLMIMTDALRRFVSVRQNPVWITGPQGAGECPSIMGWHRV